MKEKPGKRIIREMIRKHEKYIYIYIYIHSGAQDSM